MKIPVLMLIFALAATFARAEEQKTEPDPSWEAYQVIVEQNIFKKDRTPRPVEEHTTYTPEEPVVTSPQSYIVLTGIISQEDEYQAFVENRRTGTTNRVKAGDSLAEGRIAEITAEGLKFEANGETSTVALGQSLQGAAPGAAPAVLTGSDGDDSTTTSTLESTGSTPGPANSILERMRQRRLQELKK